MNVLMISTDRNIFVRDSAVASRMAQYGTLTQKLHIIVFAKRSLGLSKIQIASNVWVYPTNSFSRLLYIRDAVRIGKKIIFQTLFTKGARPIPKMLVSAQDPFETGLAGLRISRAQKIPLQIQIHTDFLNPRFLRQSLLNRIRAHIAPRVLKAANGIRVVSPRIKETLLEAFPKLSGRVDVLPIFVDVTRIREHVPAIDLHKEYPQFDQIVLVVSRLESEKNVSLALRIFQKVFQKYPKAGLIVVGSGREEKHLKILAQKFGIGESVIFAGEQRDVYSYYKTADVVLLTSNYEGYAMVLIEAAAADCPVVTTDVGIANDLMQNSERQFVCPVGDAECLARGIVSLRESAELRKVAVLKTQAVLERITLRDQEAYLRAYGKLWEACLE